MVPETLDNQKSAGNVVEHTPLVTSEHQMSSQAMSCQDMSCQAMSCQEEQLVSSIEPVLSIEDLSVKFLGNSILSNVSIAIPKQLLFAVIGPSGCGKSTFLRAINRMHDEVAGMSVSGAIFFAGRNILADADPVLLRREIGMVFQKPNPFPKSIFENIAFGLRLHGVRQRKELQQRVECALESAELFSEVKDRLHSSAHTLSGGQQQRLCIARALAVRPSVLLLDEPTSALDPRSTARIEELLSNLKKSVSLIMVTHNLGQAERIADNTAFFLDGSLREWGKTEKIFSSPKDSETLNYVTRKFG